MGPRRYLILVVIGAALFLLLGRVLAGWYVDYRWYEALGAAAVWQVRTWNLFLLRSVAFVAGSLFVFGNLYAVRRSVKSLVFPRRMGNLEIGEEVPGRYLVYAALGMSLVIGALLALPYNDWMSLELIRHGDAFRESDPYFEYDLGRFWLYWLPFEAALHLWALIAVVSVTLIVVVLYALTPSLRWEAGRLWVSAHVRRHLVSLGTMVLVLLGWSYRLDAYMLLNEGTALHMFSAVDHRVGIPVNLVLVLLTVAAALAVGWAGWIGQLRAAFFTVTAVLVLALTLRQVVPPLANRFLSPTDPDLRERPYLETRAAYTRRAYDADRLTRGVGDSTRFASAGPTLRGAALWDASALERGTARTTRTSKTSGGLGWDVMDGRLVALVATQPLGSEGNDPVPSWGLARYAGDMAGDQGIPLERQDAADDYGGRRVVVFDSVSSYIVLTDTSGRVAGTELSSFGRRLAHAWSLQNPRLVGARVPAQGRLVTRRSVRERVDALYPFFRQAPRIAPVAWRDTLYWTVHLYSTSIWYPLADPMPLGGETVRFLRHAAIALVNGHTGRVTAVPDPMADPMAATWIRRFPTLFAADGALSDDLLKRLPPATDGAVVLAAAFAQVGVRGEFVPASHLPRRSGGDTLFTPDRLSPFVDETSGQLAVAIPILDAADRVRGVVTVAGGGANESKWRPLVTTGPLWSSVIERLQRTPDTSGISLPRDAAALRGPVRVIPGPDRLSYVQTSYAGRPDGGMQVRRVAVLTGDSLGVGTTIASAVGAPAPPLRLQALTPTEFRARVEAQYAEMSDALRRGDLKAFAALYEAFGALLRMPVREP